MEVFFYRLKWLDSELMSDNRACFDASSRFRFTKKIGLGRCWGGKRHGPALVRNRLCRRGYYVIKEDILHPIGVVGRISSNQACLTRFCAVAYRRRGLGDCG